MLQASRVIYALNVFFKTTQAIAWVELGLITTHRIGPNYYTPNWALLLHTKLGLITAHQNGPN